DETGAAVGTVTSRLHRGRTELARILSPPDQDQPPRGDQPPRADQPPGRDQPHVEDMTVLEVTDVERT
ncbi:hypothetical protein AB0M20_38810, partial [Actinoplanes sp. NPDC051633]|uniref:hypothetical protein n=1 Tax=Actinoplanes sp. NPDC051633 TaxID=3155670 RepID=UPI003444F5CF